MGILDLFKKGQSSAELWTARVDDKEKIVEAETFARIIDNALMMVEEGEAEFLVLSPSSPINNLTFMQTCMDNENGMLHIEVGLNEKMENGRTKILYRDKFTVGEALDLFTDFFNGQTIDISEWDLLM